MTAVDDALQQNLQSQDTPERSQGSVRVYINICLPVALVNGVLLLKFMLVLDKKGDRGEPGDHLV